MKDLLVKQEQATFRLVVRNDVVVDAPEAARWTLGCDAGWVKAYYRLCGVDVREVEPE